MEAKIVKDISLSALTPPQFVIQSFALQGCTYFKFDECEIVIWPELMYGSYTTVYGTLYFKINYWNGSKLLLDVVADRFNPFDGEIDLISMKPFISYCLGYMKLKFHTSGRLATDIFRIC